jgi:hypothetical protein
VTPWTYLEKKDRYKEKREDEMYDPPKVIRISPLRISLLIVSIFFFKNIRE